MSKLKKKWGENWKKYSMWRLVPSVLGVRTELNNRQDSFNF